MNRTEAAAARLDEAERVAAAYESMVVRRKATFQQASPDAMVHAHRQMKDAEAQHRAARRTLAAAKADWAEIVEGGRRGHSRTVDA